MEISELITMLGEASYEIQQLANQRDKKSESQRLNVLSDNLLNAAQELEGKVIYQP